MKPKSLPPTFRVIDGGLVAPDSASRLARRARARLDRRNASEAALVMALINLVDEANPLSLPLEQLQQVHLRVRRLHGEICAVLAGQLASPHSRWCGECGEVSVAPDEDYCRECHIVRTVDAFGIFPSPEVMP